MHIRARVLGQVQNGIQVQHGTAYSTGCRNAKARCAHTPGKSPRAFSSLLEVTPMLETLLQRLPRSSSGTRLRREELGGRQK
jgi:hypothetical protein